MLGTLEAVIGVDIGGSTVSMAVVHEGGIDKSTFINYETPDDADEFSHKLGENLIRLSDESGIDIVSAGICGPVQWDGETPVSFGPTPNIEGFSEGDPVDLHERIVDEVPEANRLDVVYFNDAHIVGQAAVRLLTPDGYENEQPHMTVLVSTGIGGEILHHFQPVFRDRNVKGEYGHVGIGYPAVSIENLVSGTAIENRLGRTTKELAMATDPQAEEVWKETGETLAVGFHNLMAIFDMDHMAFVGGVSSGAFHRFAPYFKARYHDIAWAGRAQNLVVPELTQVHGGQADELALRGTIWAAQGLQR